jgi:RNAse (barnase) inhibitor barstar
MMRSWISIPDSLPWLPANEPYFLGSDDYERLVADLNSAGFDVRILKGTITGERELLEALGEALSFPDYYGGNWAAFIDCAGDIAEEAKIPVALIWPRAHELAKKSLHVFVRSAHFLLSEARDLGLSDRQFQLEVFFVGDGLGVGPSD